MDSIPFEVEKIPNGVSVKFPNPMAVSEVTIPVLDSQLWGSGNRGKIVIAKWKQLDGSPEEEKNVAIGTGLSHEPWILLKFGAIMTNQIEFFPISVEPVAASFGFSEGWKIVGVPASRQLIESNLLKFGQKIISSQKQERCFRCHLLLPYAMAVTSAENRGFLVPGDELASLGLEIIKMQNPDGSFYFSSHPNYGKITPTLCAAAVLGWLQRWTPEAQIGIEKACNFLLTFQKSTGEMRPDFFYPPFMTGPAFGTWLFSIALESEYLLAQTQGRTPLNPSTRAALKSALDWFKTENDESG
ncbi:hypothetical protein HYY75_09995, partial [bacterium]|nr:hypothetical protein [bacterium]